MPLADVTSELRKMDDYVVPAIRAAIYLGGAALLSILLSFVLRRFRKYSIQMARERSAVEVTEIEKQTRTVATLIKRVLYTVIWIVGIGLALREFNFDIGPLLAGAGVAGIAIGFAAQSILKDWINGLFLMTEGQIRINDVIRIGELSGAVEKMTLRTIALRSFDGSLHVISNGSITVFSNLTLLFSYYVFEINVDYSQDPRQMMDLMREVDADLRADPTFGPPILEPLEIVGVDKFIEAGVVVKARIKTVPGQQFAVGREFNQRLKKRCDEAGIIIATAQRAVQLFERDDPAAGLRRSTIDPMTRTELAGIIREVVRQERSQP